MEADQRLLLDLPFELSGEESKIGRVSRNDLVFEKRAKLIPEHLLRGGVSAATFRIFTKPLATDRGALDGQYPAAPVPPTRRPRNERPASGLLLTCA